jgi:SnoaL-like domain
MPEITEIIDTYIAAWNETDDARRLELVTRAWAPDATYVDPLMSGEGHKGIDAMIAAAQQQFPQHRFELSFGPDAHNGNVRFAWQLYGPDGGEPVAAGADFGSLAGDGRLQAVTGFLEEQAA